MRLLIICFLALVCVPSHVKALQNSDVTNLLEDLVEVRLTQTDNQKSNSQSRAIDLEIAKLLIENEQLELLEAFSSSKNEAALTTLAFNTSWDKWIRSKSHETGEVWKNMIRQIAPRIQGTGFGGPSPIGPNAIDQVKADDLDFISEIVEAFPGDLKEYQFKPYVSQGAAYFKLRWLSRLAARHLGSGDKKKALELLDRCSIDATRDEGLLKILSHLLRKENPNAESAKELLAEFRTDRGIFWSNCSIGHHCVANENPDGAIAAASRMEKLNLSSKRFHASSLANVYLGAATLQLVDGELTDDFLAKIRAIRLRKEDVRTETLFLCVLALANKSDSRFENPEKLEKVIQQLIDFEDDQFVKTCPLRHVESSQRLDTAIRLAQGFENPFTRAKFLCTIAERIEKNENEHGSPATRERTHRTFSVISDERAFELASQALEAVKAAPGKADDHTVERQTSLETIAKAMFVLGKIDAGREAIEQVSKQVSPEKQIYNRRGKKIESTCQEVAIWRTSYRLRSRDGPFLVNDGAEMFRFIEFALTSKAECAALPLAAIAERFAELEKWKLTEKIFRIAQKHCGDNAQFSSAIATRISENNDVDLLRHWKRICSTRVSRIKMLHRVCEHYAQKGFIPDLAMISEIEALREQLDPADPHEKYILFLVDQALVPAWWKYNQKEKAETTIKKIAEPGHNLPTVVAMIHNAYRVGMVELAERIAEEVSNSDTKEKAMLNGFKHLPSDYFSLEKLNDADWFESLPVEAQTTFRIRLIKKLLNAEPSHTEK